MLRPLARSSLSFRAISLTLAVVFLASVLLSDFPRLAYAQGEQAALPVLPSVSAASLNLPSPDKLIELSPNYQPVSLRGLRFYPDDPLRLDFILDDGQVKPDQLKLKTEASVLIKYFLSSLTIPEEDLWVNLSPYEQDKVIPQELGLTEMGKDLLGQDYLLKQLMSSLTYPETPSGQDFWHMVYKQAYQLFGTSKIPINTFNKVWIVPDKAVIYEDKDRAILGEARLKVMLEEDYLAFKNRPQTTIHSLQKKIELTEKDEENINKFSSSIMKEVILPAIEKEVNEGKNFAQLRQIYHSLILAIWFKQKLKAQINQDSNVAAQFIAPDNNGLDKSSPYINQTPAEPLLSKIYVDKKKIKGVESADPKVKEKVYSLYLEAYKNGLYNYIKKDFDPYEKKQLKRRYYSGGFDGTGVRFAVVARPLTEIPPNLHLQASSSVAVELNPASTTKVFLPTVQPGKRDNVEKEIKIKRTVSSPLQPLSRIKNYISIIKTNFLHWLVTKYIKKLKYPMELDVKKFGKYLSVIIKGFPLLKSAEQKQAIDSVVRITKDDRKRFIPIIKEQILQIVQIIGPSGLPLYEEILTTPGGMDDTQTAMLIFETIAAIPESPEAQSIFLRYFDNELSDDLRSYLITISYNFPDSIVTPMMRVFVYRPISSETLLLFLKRLISVKEKEKILWEIISLKQKMEGSVFYSSNKSPVFNLALKEFIPLVGQNLKEQILSALHPLQVKSILVNPDLLPGDRQLIESHITQKAETEKDSYFKYKDSIFNLLSTNVLLDDLLNLSEDSRWLVLEELGRRMNDAYISLPLLMKVAKDEWAIQNHYFYNTLAQLGRAQAEVIKVFEEAIRNPDFNVRDVAISAIIRNHLQVTSSNGLGLIESLIQIVLAPSLIESEGRSSEEKKFALIALSTLKHDNPQLSYLIGPVPVDEKSISGKIAHSLITTEYPFFASLPKEYRYLATDSLSVNYLIEISSLANGPVSEEGIYETIDRLGYLQDLFELLFLVAMKNRPQTELKDFLEGDPRTILLVLWANPRVSGVDRYRESNIISQEKFKAMLNKLSPEELIRVRKLISTHPEYFTFEELEVLFPDDKIRKLISETRNDGAALRFWSKDVMPKEEARRQFTEIMSSVYRQGSGSIMPEKNMLLPGTRAILVVDKDKKIIGFIHYSTNGFLDELVVIPEHQGKGFATRLLKAASYDLARIGHQRVKFNIADREDLKNPEKDPEDFYHSFARKNCYEFTGGTKWGVLWGNDPSVLKFPLEIIDSTKPMVSTDLNSLHTAIPPIDQIDQGKTVSSEVGKATLCLTPDSLITLADGSQKPLIALRPLSTYEVNKGKEDGDMVLSLNEATGKLEPHRVLALLDMGVKPVYRITTASGKSLKTTLTHPYLTREGWKKLKDIKVGEEITVAREDLSSAVSVFSSINSVNHNAFTSQIKTDTILSDSESMGGRGEVDQWSSKGEGVSRREVKFNLFKDASLELKGEFLKFSFTSGSELDFLNHRGFQLSPNLCLILEKGTNPNLLASSMPFFSLNTNLGFIGRWASIPSISQPTGLWNTYSLAETCSSSLASTAQSKSHNEYVSKTKYLGEPFLSTTTAALKCEDLRPASLSSLGREANFSSASNLTVSLADNFTKDVDFIFSPPDNFKYNTLISGLSRLFSIPEAEASQIKGTSSNSDILWDKIISIEPLGLMPVYDIEVEATHNFIAQGILAHNTYNTERTEDSGQKTEREKDATSSAVRISYEDLANVPNTANQAQGIIEEMKKEYGQPYEIRSIDIDSEGKKIEVINWFKTLGAEEWQTIEDVLGKFRSIAGGKFLKEIYYLAIEPMDKPNPNAPDENLNGWGAVNGVFKLFPNAFNQEWHRVRGVPNLTGTLIHELGHPVADALVNTWREKFPENNNHIAYITSYAKTNAKEDIAETMIAAILGIDYSQQVIVQEKINFLQKILGINPEQPFCLTPDSLIILADGRQKPLIELKPHYADRSQVTSHRSQVTGYKSVEEGGAGKGKVKTDGDGDWVLSLNEQTQKLEPHRVLALLDMGVKPVYRITTQSGKSLKTTLTHPYLTRDGWKKLSEIKVGEEIRVAEEYSYSRFTDISDGRGDDLRGNGRRELLPRALIQWLKQLKDWLTPQSSFAGQIITPIAPTTVINSQEVTLIPKETFKKSEAILPANQSGKTPPIKVWDTKRLLSVVQKSLFSINLSHFNNKKYTTPSRSSQDNLRTTLEPIISIDYIGSLPVYDIEVEATHNFIAQGIVAHNTYANANGKSLIANRKEETAGSALEKKGGIDLHPQNLYLKVIGEGGVGSSPLNPIPFDLENFQGFTFQIISLQPADSWETAFVLPSQETENFIS